MRFLIHGRHARIFGQNVDHIFDQIVGQVFDQIFSQGFDQIFDRICGQVFDQVSDQGLKIQFCRLYRGKKYSFAGSRGTKKIFLQVLRMISLRSH